MMMNMNFLDDRYWLKEEAVTAASCLMEVVEFKRPQTLTRQ